MRFMLQWFIVHTYSGYEQRVKDLLLERASAEGLQDKVAEVLIPSETVVERNKQGKTVTSARRFFPGYILVRLECSPAAKDDDEETRRRKQEENFKVWALVRGTPRVTGFVGPGAEPTPIADEEVDRIVHQVAEATEETPQPRLHFDVGDSVRIVGGPFMDFTGVVEDINGDRHTLKIMVSIFGRATPVEVDFLQAEKV
jgi:transcriptional antiterminator NusG